MNTFFNQKGKMTMGTMILDEKVKVKKKSTKRNVLLFVFIAVALLASVYFLYNKQVNIIIMGIDGARTDTMILASVNTQNKTVKTLSIPRDTYYPTEGRNGLGQKKINAVYGFKDIGGPEGVKRTVSKLLGIKIDYYVLVDYDAVKKMVDTMGGIPVDVPFKMQYSDPYAKPPLVINIESGPQVLKGEDAIGYLRFRQSSDGKIREGDVQRIARQQAFLESAFEKAKSPKLPYYVFTGLNAVETDMPLMQTTLIGIAMIGTNSEKFEATTLPMQSTGRGSDGLSYFFHHSEETHQLMKTWGLK